MCIAAYKYVTYLLFFSKYMYHCLDVLLRVCSSCLCSALKTICSILVGLRLDIPIAWLLYVVSTQPQSG